MRQNVKLKRISIGVCVLLLVGFLSSCVKEAVRLSEADKHRLGEIILIIKKPHYLRTFRHDVSVSLGDGYRHSGEMIRMQTDESKTEHFSNMAKSLNSLVVDNDLLTKMEESIKKTLGESLNANIVNTRYVNYLDTEEIEVLLDSNNGKSIVYVDYDYLFTPGLEVFDVRGNMEIYSYSKSDSASKLIYTGNYVYQAAPAVSDAIKQAKDNLGVALANWGKHDYDSDNAVPYPFNDIVDLLNAYTSYWADNEAEVFKKSLNEAINQITKMIEVDISDKLQSDRVALPYKDYRDIQPFSKKGELVVEGDRLVNFGDGSILRGPKGVLFSLKNKPNVEFNSYGYDRIFIVN